MNKFEKDGLSYRAVQKLNGGAQWECDYHDFTTARTFIAKKDTNVNFIVRAFELLNEKNEANKSE